MKLKRYKSGFSLIELMVATGIIALISAVAIPSYLKFVSDADRVEGVSILLNAWRAQEDIKYKRQTRYTDWQYDYSTFFEVTDPSYPTLDFRPSGGKYNLIIGGINCGFPGEDRFSLDRIGLNYPEVENNAHFGGASTFGGGCDTQAYIMGAERIRPNGDIDLLVVNQDGQVAIACDRGNAVPEGADIIANSGGDQAKCTVSGGGGGGSGSGGGGGGM